MTSLETTTRTLDTGWRVREAPLAGIPAHNQLPWLPAVVPSHVHLDLQRAGVIPDPFVRLHERDVQWVDDSDWEYETTFHVDAPAPPNAFLRFLGLDTVADITLNGERLGTTDNMFIPHEFPVTGKLKAGDGADGDNTLRVTFHSAKRIGAERHAAWDAAGNDTTAYHWDNWAERAFVRKAQYMYGWDWGPVLRSCGLWRPVELVTVPVARLGNWKHDVEFTDDGKALVTVTADVERAPGHEDTPLTFTMRMSKYEEPADYITEAVIGNKARATLTIDEPELWWPRGYGFARCYALDMALHVGEESEEDKTDKDKVDEDGGLIGLRTIELVREPDADGSGEGFKFRVNGVDIFIKGANWIPERSFPSAAPETKEPEEQRRVRQARDAGFNMLRVWGGGLYESEYFYLNCSLHGILVWQDFAYGCAYYPDDAHYQEAARVEAVAAVRRIRNHPSLALWCGNNENQMMWDTNWTGQRPPHLLGDPLYHEVLPAVVAAEDPKTPYWPSSPFGGPDSNSETHGDCHNWDVWHGRGDWTHYPENDARFCSEFGFASSCGLAAWDTCLAPEDKHPQSLAVRWHDKTRKGYDTYLGYIGLHFPVPQTLEDLVYYSQWNQAEALKCGVEHYRRRKGHCWGTLFWQINDCWPVQSWAIIDSLGEPKAAYFACKRFYAPLLLSLVRDGERVRAHLINDHLHTVAGMLILTLETFDGERLAQETHAVSVGANGAEEVASFSLATARGRERDVFVYAQFQPGEEGEPVTNLLLLAEPKDLRLASSGVSVTVSDISPYTIQIMVRAERFAPCVWVRRTDNAPLTGLTDNFFPLRAGETRTITLPRPNDLPSADALRARLAIRTL